MSNKKGNTAQGAAASGDAGCHSDSTADDGIYLQRISPDVHSLPETIRTFISEYEAYVISARRRVHVWAETSGNEYKTSSFITQELEGLGITVQKVSNTGVIGVLDTGRPGATLALRADIDALSIEENPDNLLQPRVCKSENPGACHACGHDAHTAMLLGAARVLTAVQATLTGKLLFCFEEGEELGLGVRGMLDALREHRPDAVWALHVLSTLEAGKVDISPGPRMAGGRRIIMRVNGRGGHGSRPDLSLNPVYAAAAITANISGALQNQLNPDKPVTVGITSIQGGASENIFPEYADVKGTIRFFDADEGLRASEIVKRVASGTAAMLGCSVDFDSAMDWSGMPVINNREVAERTANVLSQLGYSDTLTECPPWYASESFASYLSEYPGAFAFLGIRNDELGTGAPHHNDRFDVDEAALATGVAANVAFAVSGVISA